MAWSRWLVRSQDGRAMGAGPRGCRQRVAGRARRPALVIVEPFSGKVDELVDRSRAQVRADRAHEILVGMEYAWSYRRVCGVVSHDAPSRCELHVGVVAAARAAHLSVDGDPGLCMQ